MRTKIYDQKLADVLSKITVYCKCGHTNYIPSYKSKIICNWCGRSVYKNNYEEFKEKLTVKLRKENMNYENN